MRWWILIPSAALLAAGCASSESRRTTAEPHRDSDRYVDGKDRDGKYRTDRYEEVDQERPGYRQAAYFVSEDPDDGQPYQRPNYDRKRMEVFLDKVVSGGHMEMELSRTAAERAENERIREFARHMAADHTEINQEAQRLADAKGLPVRETMTREKQQEVREIEELRGGEFDRAYVSKMLEAHDLAVTEFERQAEEAKDNDIRAFAQRNLPTLRDHHQRVREIAREIGLDDRAPQRASR